MKMTRKLFPALIMLLVSAIMLSTASYAWFASNSTVSASNLKVKVKSNSRFLEIGTDPDEPFNKSVDYSSDALQEIELVTAKFSKEDTNVLLKWYTGESSELGSVGTTSGTALENITSTYALQKRVYVRMSQNSTDGLSNLAIDTASGKAPTVTTTGGEAPTNLLAQALRILVVATDNSGNITGSEFSK